MLAITSLDVIYQLYIKVGGIELPRVYILTDMCKGMDDCGICGFVCPKGVLGRSEEPNERGFIPPVVVHGESCTGCETCMVFCPDMAIVVEKARGKVRQNRRTGELR